MDHWIPAADVAAQFGLAQSGLRRVATRLEGLHMARKNGRDWQIEQRAVDHYALHRKWPTKSAPLLELEAQVQDRTLQSALDAAEIASLRLQLKDAEYVALLGEMRVLRAENAALRRSLARAIGATRILVDGLEVPLFNEAPSDGREL